MLREDIISKLIEYENSHPVNDYSYLDWNCWPLLRIISSFQLNQYAQKESSGLRSRVIRHLRQKITDTHFLGSGLHKLYNKELTRRTGRELETVLRNDLRHSDRPDDPEKDIVILTQSGRRTRLGENLFDIYSDPLVINFRNKGLSILVWEQGAEYWPRYSNSAWITKRLAIEASVIRNLVPEKPPGWFIDFSSWSKSTFNHEIKWQNFRKIIHSVHARSIVFGGWLDNCGARLLISVCWYDPMVMAATLAAKRLGVTSVDLQHGIQDKGHFAYSGWDHIPVKAYELIPDYFWSWGSSEADQLMEINPAFKTQCKAVTGGNLWYNLWRDKNDFLIDTPDRICKDIPREKTILVTLQHGPANFAELIVEVITDSSTDWFWLIRLHPATPTHEADHIRNLLDKIDMTNIDYQISSSAPLYSLIDNCDVLITGHSTCALEALGFGVPAITVNKNGAAAFRKYIEYGVIMSARSRSTVKEAIEVSENISADRCRESVSRVFAITTEAISNIDNLLSATTMHN